MKISQKVVLRGKVRRQNTRYFLQAVFKVLKIFVGGFFIVFATFRVYKFLFHSDFFLIKSVIFNDQNDVSTPMAADLKHFLGQSIFFISTGKTESRLREGYPQILALSLRRGLPDRLRVTFSLRESQALVRTPKHFQGIDREGKIFPLPKNFFPSQKPIPELDLEGDASPAESLMFLEFWQKAVQKLGALPSLSLTKITLDKYGELSLDLAPDAPNGAPRRIAWGRPENFEEKFKRLMRVNEDLKERKIQAKTIDLSGIPGQAGAKDSGASVDRVFVSVKKGND